MPDLPKVSVREKVLLHLAEAAPGPDAPPTLAATQVGLANATGLHRGHVSRALDPLAAEGLVAKARRRVPGFARALLVFTLTPAGQAAARALREGLEQLVVEVRRPGAPPARQPLGEALRQGPRRSLPEALRQLEAEGFLEGGSAAPARPEPGHVWDLEDAPVVHGFVGRPEEVALLARWMRTPDPSCLVEGPGGIGKSSLVAHVLEQARPPRHVLWLRLSPSMGPELVLARVGEFLRRLGRSLTPATPSAPAVPDAVLERLPERLRGLSVLLVVDDVHKADPALRQAFERFAAAADRRGDLKVVWIGRTLLLPVAALRRSLRLPLAPLTPAGSRALLASLAVPAERREAITRAAGGNPLLLELMAAGRDVASAREDFVRHLTEDLARLASPSAQGLLKHLCALRVPVARAALERLGPAVAADLDGLARAHLVATRTDGALEVHDEVRAAVYAKLEAGERRRIHEVWARAFEPRGDLDDVLEFLHHLTQAGRRAEAAWWALRNQTQLLQWARGKFRPAAAPPVAA